MLTCDTGGSPTGQRGAGGQHGDEPAVPGSRRALCGVRVDTGPRCQRTRSFLWDYVAETAKLGFEPQFVRIAGDPWETGEAGDTGRWVRR